MMIDSEKLMGRMESKGTVLSEKSISNVGVIRRKLVDIDGMLKDKLVLAKVKEGIRRQEEERLKRVEREDGIEESDDDRDIDMDGEKSKRKKPKPGGPSNASSILGPVGAILAGGGLALIAKNLGTFRVTAQILKGIGSGALITFMGAATAINAGYKVVNAIETKTLQMFGDKGLQTLKQFQKVFSTFVNVAVVTAVTAGGASVLGKTRKGLFPGGFKRPKFKSNKISGITDLTTPIKKPIIKLRRGGINLDKLKEGRKITKTKSPKKEKVAAEKIIREAQKESGGGQGSILRGKNLRKKTPLETVVKQAAENNPGEFFDATGNINVTDPSTREALQSALKKDGTSAREISERVSKMNPDQRRIFFGGSGMDDEGVGAPRGTKPTSSKIDPNQTLFDKMFKNVPTGEGGLDIEDPFGGPGAMKLRRGIISNADNITNVKSFSTLLEAFGGLPLVKATRQFLGNTLGRIPLLGDLIGILLDVFVFKQPIQKALFMAAGGALGGSIGAWLGGILGTVVPVVGNLAGAVVGGFLGGVGGDMLGGFLYDTLFAGKPGFPAATTQNPLEKGAKGTLKLGLSGGGLVPAALLSMNNGGSVPDIAYSASYDRPGAGSVRFIPIPITSSSDTGSTTRSSGGVIVTKRKRSQPSLYAGGLIT